jgi:trans-aconitate methyltransferase
MDSIIIYISIFIYKLDLIYSWDAYNYSSISNLQYDTSVKFMSEISFNNNASILDIGCGPGKITYYICNNITNGSVMGIDKSNDMIAYAKLNYNKYNLYFDNKDVLNMTFDTKFDTVISFFCIPWIDNKYLAFKNIANVMKNNSRLYILAAVFEPTHARLITNLIQKPHWESYFINYSSPFNYMNDIKYDIYANNSGIRTDILELSDVYYTFKNRQELAKFNLIILPHVIRVSNEKRNIFVEELLDDYFDYIKSENYTIKFNIIKFIGTKI